MEFEMKHYDCSLCKKNVPEQLLQKQGFTIVKCKDCGFVYVNPRVSTEQLSTIYQHNYFKNKDYGYAGYEQEKRLRVKNFQRWLNDAEIYFTKDEPVSALDVGCAAGYCLDVMKSKGWLAEGLELDEEMSAALQQNGYTVSTTRLEEFRTENKYSIITLFDVIEHIPDIDAAFNRLNYLLKKDGIVVMVTPNYNSLQRKLFGKRWFQYKPVEHIQYFDEKSLSYFAERNNLKMILHKRCGQYADTQFILNRLSYYHFPMLSKLFSGIFALLRLKNKFYYTDTGSLFVVFKKA